MTSPRGRTRCPQLDATFSGAVLSPAATRVAEAPAGVVGGPANPDAYPVRRPFRGGRGRGALARPGTGSTSALSTPPRPGSPRAPSWCRTPRTSEDAAQATAAQTQVLRIERVQGLVPAGRQFRQPKVALYSPSAYYDAESRAPPPFEQVWTMPDTPLSATERARRGAGPGRVRGVREPGKFDWQAHRRQGRRRGLDRGLIFFCRRKWGRLGWRDAVRRGRGVDVVLRSPRRPASTSRAGSPGGPRAGTGRSLKTWRRGPT